MSEQVYEPKGLRFIDRKRGECVLVEEGDKSGFGGWICFRHPDGQWVTLRKATDEDFKSLAPLQQPRVTEIAPVKVGPRQSYSCKCGFNIVDDTGNFDEFNEQVDDHINSCSDVDAIQEPAPTDPADSNPTEEITGTAVSTYCEEIVHSVREAAQLSGKHTAESFLQESEAKQWGLCSLHALQAFIQSLTPAATTSQHINDWSYRKQVLENIQARLAGMLGTWGMRTPNKPHDTGVQAGNNALSRAAQGVYLRDRAEKPK